MTTNQGDCPSAKTKTMAIVMGAIGEAEERGRVQGRLEKLSEILALRSACETAAMQFEFYARQHDVKTTQESSAKAAVNREMAAMCRAAIPASSEPTTERPLSTANL